jgi:hypothetical protein
VQLDEIIDDDKSLKTEEFSLKSDEDQPRHLSQRLPMHKEIIIDGLGEDQNLDKVIIEN